jgi:hypothetical protein
MKSTFSSPRSEIFCRQLETAQKIEKKATETSVAGHWPGKAPGAPRSTALFGALAGVFLAACGHAALQTDALTTAACAEGHAWQCWQWRGEFTVCFGDDFVAHLWLRIKMQNGIKPQEWAV